MHGFNLGTYGLLKKWFSLLVADVDLPLKQLKQRRRTPGVNKSLIHSVILTDDSQAGR